MRHDPVQPGKGLVTELRPARRAEAPRDRVKSSLGGRGAGNGEGWRREEAQERGRRESVLKGKGV